MKTVKVSSILYTVYFGAFIYDVLNLEALYILSTAMFATFKDAKLVPQKQDEVKPHHHSNRGGHHHHYQHHHHGRQRYHHTE